METRKEAERIAGFKLRLIIPRGFAVSSCGTSSSRCVRYIYITDNMNKIIYAGVYVDGHFIPSSEAISCLRYRRSI